MKKQYSIFNVHNFKSGFTLVEMIVTVSIVSIIMSVVLFSYSSFSDKLTVSSAVQEISLAVRQAQIYGLSVKESSTGSGQFLAGYGVYFSMSDTANYYLFSDLNNNGFYDGTSACTAGGECLQKIPFRNGVTITGICGTLLSGSETCPPTGATSINITFLRPSTDAKIRFNGTETGLFKTGKINLKSFKNSTGFVKVENTGQISVQ